MAVPLLTPLLQRLHAPVYASRLERLVTIIVAQLEPGDRVLDVGCGFGALGRALLDDPRRPEGVTVRGLERTLRPGAQIEVDGYPGGRLPYADDAFDVVILADVLHHEPEPHALLAECGRVARRRLIIKDHKVDGPLAQWRISLLDWAANAPYGVPCLYRYNSAATWRVWHERHGFRIADERLSLDLYPAPFETLFGGRLHYLAVLEPGAASGPSSGDRSASREAGQRLAEPAAPAPAGR